MIILSLWPETSVDRLSGKQQGALDDFRDGPNETHNSSSTCDNCHALRGEGQGHQKLQVERDFKIPINP